ncbi:hypothetical protein [Isoptericola dokdonensis]|uniref:hypothetical protein n=1 Tax=Isoptericola dokdonensis TaxID=372663 RepID=UPI0012F778E3|nr:hypothetical protein [Isoptericola dokdonensis]
MSAALVFVVLVGGLAVADARVLVAVWQKADAFRSAGAAVTTLVSESGPVVDGSRCAALVGAGGLTGSAALRPGEPVRAANLPDSDLTVWEATPGLVAVLARVAHPVSRLSSDDESGVWVADDLAATLGARAGDGILLADGRTMQVAGVYSWPDDGRDRVLSYAVVVPVAAAGSFERCWAEAWPADSEAAGLLYSVAAPGAEDVQVGRLNATLGSELDVAAEIATRPTAPAPLVAVAVGLVLGFLLVRTRRLELASALHAGVAKPFLAWQIVLETGAWLLAAVLVGAAATGVASLMGNPEPFVGTWLAAVSTVVVGAAAVLLGTAVGALAVKEVHLFRYFKDR